MTHRLPAALVALITFTAPLLAQAPVAPDVPVIVAQGDAVLMLPPDRAYVQIAAEGRAAKVADAQRQAAAAMTAVQSALRTMGLAADMMRSTSYVVQPEYDNAGGHQTFRDYFARHVLEVRVDDLSQLGDVIDRAGASGAAMVSSLRFDLKNRGAIEQDALRRAVKDATERARAMADGAGRALGEIVRLQEQRSSSASPMFAMAGGGGGRGGAAYVTPVEPGELQVRAQVTLTIAMK